METNKYKNEFVDFIQRMKYDIVLLTNDTANKVERIDHVNKLVFIKHYSFDKVLDASLRIALWLNSFCVYNFFTFVFKDYKTFVEEVKKLILDDYSSIHTKNYEEFDFKKYCHLYNPHSLKNNKRDAIIFIVSKMLNKDDNHFNPKHEHRIYPKEKDIDYNLYKIICEKYDGIIGGSFAISCYGEIYRKSFHDLDYLVYKDVLNENVIDIIDSNITSKTLTFDEIEDIKQSIKEEFINSPMAKDIFKIYPDAIINRIGIEKLSIADMEIGCLVNIIINYKSYDIMFLHKGFKRIICHVGTKKVYVRDAQDAIRIKKNMNREKDIIDLILWKPDYYFNVDNKDVVELIN